MTTGSGPAACAWELNPRSLQHSSFSGAIQLMRVAQVKVRPGGPEVPVSIALLQSALIPQVRNQLFSRIARGLIGGGHLRPLVSGVRRLCLESCNQAGGSQRVRLLQHSMEVMRRDNELSESCRQHPVEGLSHGFLIHG